MIDEVVGKVKNDRIVTVGILGTPSTLREKLYQKPLETNGINCIEPAEKHFAILEKIIRNVLAGTVSEKDRKQLGYIADDLRHRGAEAIILGCTELPLAFPLQYTAPVYNSVEILAMTLLRRYYE